MVTHLISQALNSFSPNNYGDLTIKKDFIFHFLLYNWMRSWVYDYHIIQIFTKAFFFLCMLGFVPVRRNLVSFRAHLALQSTH